LLPSAASSTKTLRPAHVLPTEIPAKAFKRRSSARRLIAHGNPPCDPLACPTLPRPSHPAPNVRDDRDTPLLVGRDAWSCTGDLGQSRSGIFLRARLDGANQVDVVEEIRSSAHSSRGCNHPRHERVALIAAADIPTI